MIIGIGAFFLLAQFIPDIGRWIPLFIGLIFLAAFLPKREYGFLIPGCIVSGVGVGVVLAGALDDPGRALPCCSPSRAGSSPSGS